MRALVRLLNFCVISAGTGFLCWGLVSDTYKTSLPVMMLLASIVFFLIAILIELRTQRK